MRLPGRMIPGSSMSGKTAAAIRSRGR